MFLTEGIYDIDELARFNLHIHTCFSGCAKDEMTFENIVKSAEDAGLHTIALCDHIYEPEDLPEFNQNCEILRRKRDELDSKVKILIGGEFSCYSTDMYTLKDSDIKTEYRLYAQNHFHVTGWQQAEEKTPEAYKELTKKMLRNLFKDKAADTIAHPLNGTYLRKMMGWEADVLGNCWRDDEIAEILKEGYDSGCAWELNAAAFSGDPMLIKRMYSIGKELGVVFTIGMDAHRLENVNTKDFAEALKRTIL